MASFLRAQSDYRKRSISLPCRSHPSTNTIDVELNKLKSHDTSSSTQNANKIINGLSGLMDLLRCLEDLLNLQMTNQALSHDQCEKFVHNLQDEFISLLDICGIVRDFISQIKENGRKVQTYLRRQRNRDTNFETIFTENTCLRKKMIKDAKKSISELKQMENRIGAMPILELDNHVSSVIRSLREVVAMSSIVLNSISFFLCAPILKARSKWFAVSKLLQKGALVACENQIDSLNDLQSLDLALDQLYKSDLNGLKDDKKVQEALSILKSLEINVGVIGHKLECVFRGLIKTRANLLNISSNIL